MNVFVAGGGPPVLVLHGIPGQSEGMRAVAQGIADEGYQVIVPDLLGFGASGTSADVYVDAQADALAQVLRSLRIDRLHVVAHDYGVPVAVKLASRHADVKILGLVAAATNLFPDTAIPLPLRLARYGALRWLLWPVLGTVPGARMAFRAGSGRAKAGQYRLARVSARSTYAIFCRSLSDLAGIYGPIERAAASLGVPAVVLWGTKDPFFSTATGRRTAELLKAEFVLLEGAGHFIPEEAPTEMVQAFLRVARVGALASRRT